MVLRVLVACGAWLGIGSCGFAVAADAIASYERPAPQLTALVDRPATPAPRISRDNAWILFLERPALTGLADIAYPRAHLAGVVIDTRSNARGDGARYTGAAWVRVSDGSRIALDGLPGGGRILDALWAPDSSAVALLVQGASGVTVWRAQAGRAAQQLSTEHVNAVFDDPCAWLPDSVALVCRFVPPQRGSLPTISAVPEGPIVRDSSGDKAPARTYAGLLKTPADELQFDFYAQSRLGRVSVAGELNWLPVQGLVTTLSPSPDGRYVLTELRHRPYSHALPWDRFPNRIALLELATGRSIPVADLPMDVQTPIDSDAVAPAPRGHRWRADAPATLFWAEAQDGGDPRRDAKVRDRAFLWPAPFEATPVVLGDFALRLEEIYWARGDLALAVASWWKTRQVQVWRVYPDAPLTRPVQVLAYSSEDRYADPGVPLQTRNAGGHRVLETEEDAVFLAGPGASAKGEWPVLTRFDVANRKSSVVWQGEGAAYEQPVARLGGGEILTRRETASTAPVWQARSLDNGAVRMLSGADGESLPALETRLLRYRRADGLALSATLYLPPGYRAAQGALPVVLMAYPDEFRSAAAAGQVRGSPHRYRAPFLDGPLAYALQGYAVLDRAAMPIVSSEGMAPNDSYIGQLVMNAQAAVDEVVRLGVGDRKRIAIAGHSYGAAMVVSLLANSELFCAGIAMSGAYNRTLTPFGFQEEERNLWEAPQTYLALSPLLRADRIRAPLLLIHGAEDPNDGTSRMQSERLFDALKGLGKKARLVILPHEGHGYRARESVLHVLAEQGRLLAAECNDTQ